MHFFLLPASSPQELVTSVRWWLAGTVRLGLLPGLWVALPEVLVR